MPPTPQVPYVLAAPGYLAGGGSWDHLTELLHHGHGWHYTSETDLHTRLTSPDQRLHVTLAHARPHPEWILTGPAWQARIGVFLPVEYVTAIVDAMRSPAPDPPAALDPLATAGWTTRRCGTARTAVSPDETVSVTEERAPDGTPEAWYASCTAGGLTWWNAVFPVGTPLQVAAAFTGSLASPDPLVRMAVGIPLYNCGSYTRFTPTDVSWHGERVGLDARIAQARAARRPAPAATPPPAAP
uniref:DUF317 domain-containing protein n=1 Tax=Streptomyces acidiscabies TaxID=42234 RepID=UPI0009530A76